jgi:peptidoglycan lytic transglycosylase B
MIQTRRIWLQGVIASALMLATGGLSHAQRSRLRFEQWVATFRKRALKRGISGKTYDRVMNGLKPDTSVYALQSAQPEFKEATWQYLSRRVSDWRVKTGKEIGSKHAALLQRIERELGVDRYILLALWGVESAFGDPAVQEKYMRPIFPALAALAWGEPRRRRYWEKELLNALVIVERGWGKPTEMRGSWAGAMGHTQWMPEVWLNVGVDYDKDGRIYPFGSPHDALAGTANYLKTRGRYRRGEAWGCEVKLPPKFNTRLADRRTWRSYAQWSKLGVARADDKPFPRPNDRVRLWLPVKGGPAFLIGQNFYAARSYNPSYSYTLALVHLGDRIKGGESFQQQFPGGERTATLDELKELQRRLKEHGFDPGGTDGRVGSSTMRAVRRFQEKVGMEPADGYPGLGVLERLRKGS